MYFIVYIHAQINEKISRRSPGSSWSFHSKFTRFYITFLLTKPRPRKDDGPASRDPKAGSQRGIKRRIQRVLFARRRDPKAGSQLGIRSRKDPKYDGNFTLDPSCDPVFGSRLWIPRCDPAFPPGDTRATRWMLASRFGAHWGPAFTYKMQASGCFQSRPAKSPGGACDSICANPRSVRP